MILGILRTKIIEDHIAREGGVFEVTVTLDEALAQNSGAVYSFFAKTIAIHLANSVQCTGVPVEYWTFTTDPRVTRKYSFPSFLDFGVTK